MCVSERDRQTERDEAEAERRRRVVCELASNLPGSWESLAVVSSPRGCELEAEKFILILNAWNSVQ